MISDDHSSLRRTRRGAALAKDETESSDREEQEMERTGRTSRKKTRATKPKYSLDEGGKFHQLTRGTTFLLGKCMDRIHELEVLGGNPPR